MTYDVKMRTVDRCGDSCRALVIIRDGIEIGEFWDGGEPEDQSFSRDWGWVQGALKQAYQFGYHDGMEDA